MMNRLQVVLFSLSLVIAAECEPIFHHGRPRDGFVGVPNVQVDEKNLPPAQWIKQELDHFTSTDTRTWVQRYFTNKEYYNSNYVFLMIGGEGPANPIWTTTGTWIEYAKKLSALCFFVEHRFYGESHPTGDMKTANLEHLSSEQALADLASFIVNKTIDMNLENHKWVVFGGSYSGNLAAWMRLKYPHLVTAAVATSAPVQAKMNFEGYLEVTTQSLQTSPSGTQCTDAIKNATKTLEDALTSATTWKELEPHFKLCKPLNLSNENDKMQLASTLAGNFEGVVQYNNDNRAFEGAVGTNITIDYICNIMVDHLVGAPILRYAKVNELMLKTYDETCLDASYGKMIDFYKQTSWQSAAGVGGRQWMYQTCTEFGYYQSSNSENQVFGSLFPLSFWSKQCKDIFGSLFTSDFILYNVKKSNMIYGSYNISGTNIVFPNGKIDQWHYLGITESSMDHPMEPAIFIEGTAHCADMYPASPNDPPQLVQARETILNHLQQWLH